MEMKAPAQPTIQRKIQQAPAELQNEVIDLTRSPPMFKTKSSLRIPKPKRTAQVDEVQCEKPEQAAVLQQQQQQQPQTQQIPINSGAPPKPEALAVAQFLKTQDLKPRQCQFNNQRKELFKVKRAIRALMSPAYEKARKKNALLPEVNDRVTAENTFKMLPMSLLALRVSKIDEHEGHDHAKKKTKGFWTVKVEPQQVRRSGSRCLSKS